MRINEKIKQLRLNRGLSLEKLAHICNLTKGYLSKIERSDEPPPVSTLQTIANALGVDIAAFFDTSSEPDALSGNLDIVHCKEIEEDVASDAGYSFRPLVRRFGNKYMSPFLMTIEPGKTGTFSHDSEEFNYIAEGSITFCYEGNNYELKAGDSFYFDSRKSHSFVNTSDNTAIIVSIGFNYRRF